MRKIILRWLGIEKHLQEMNTKLNAHEMIVHSKLYFFEGSINKLNNVDVKNMQRDMVFLTERVTNLYRPKWDRNEKKIQIQYYRRLVAEGFNKPYDYPPAKRPQQQKKRKQK